MGKVNIKNVSTAPRPKVKIPSNVQRARFTAKLRVQKCRVQQQLRLKYKLAKGKL